MVEHFVKEKNTEMLEQMHEPIMQTTTVSINLHKLILAFQS